MGPRASRSNSLVGAATLLAVVGMACRGPRADAGVAPSAATSTAPVDSLVLELADGAQVWLAEGREARDSAGTTCYERSVEIRKPGATITVPLLYTTRAPAVLDRGTLRAELSKACRVMAIYRVDVATGRPTKISDQ
ncbi:MAG: hypothetical protein ACKVZ0_00535 [Gemmatimonadales bacterium]